MSRKVPRHISFTAAEASWETKVFFCILYYILPCIYTATHHKAKALERQGDFLKIKLEIFLKKILNLIFKNLSARASFFTAQVFSSL